MINRLLPFLKVFVPFLVIYFSLELYFQFLIGVKISFIHHLMGVGFSTLFALNIASIPLVLSMLFGAKFPKWIMGFSIIYLSFLLIIHSALQGYLLQTGILLGADFYGYTLDEIVHTINASASSGFATSITIILILGAFGGLIYVLRNRSFSKAVSISILALCILSWLIPGGPSDQFENESTKSLVTNPSNHFWSKSVGYILDSRSEGASQKMDEFPFLHDLDTKNPFGDWFNKSDTPPNIVIIAVEGLGADFVGPKAQYGGFTPYLDSLIGKSIYFENALSNTGRTFGALPTLLGSLPYSQSGFMSKGVDMPDHFTLFSWLKTNGYHTAFFYGGNANFDGQDVFLERQKTDYIMDESKFPAQYQKMKGNNEGFSWGYGDRDVFDFSIEKINSFPSKPRISFYMTITTHEPFIAPDDRFSEQVNSKVNKFKGTKKEIYQEYKSVFECLMYTDDAIKQLMNSYSKRADFKNTIFIITGDHRLIPVPAEHRLSRFHVPLIIYSPMMKKPFVSEQVVAHSQIVPSITAYLYQTYSVPMSEQVAFISDPLPTEVTFGSSLQVALMRNKNEIEEYVSGIDVLSNGSAYELGPNFSLTSKPEVKEELSKLMGEFISKSTVALNENRLLPSDLVLIEADKYFQFTDQERQFLKERKLLRTAPDTLFFEARSLAFVKEYEKSRIILKYGLSKSPNYHDMRVLLARTFAWEGAYDSAYRYLDQTLERAEKYEDAYVAYSDLLFWDGKKDEMLAMIKKGMENYPKSLDLKARMARYYLNNDEINKGTILVNEVLKLDSKNELGNQLKQRIPNQ